MTPDDRILFLAYCVDCEWIVTDANAEKLGKMHCGMNPTHHGRLVAPQRPGIFDCRSREAQIKGMAW